MNLQPDLLPALNLPNAAIPLPQIVTAGQPQAADFERLARAGFKSVIDLRLPDESRGFDEPSTVRSAGLDYHNIPVSLPTLGDGQFDEFRKLLCQDQSGAVLIHCGTANRVGALLIPHLVLDQGRTTTEALAIARSVGLRSDDLGRAAISYVEKQQSKNTAK